jgi:hypothetical protein
MVETLTNLGPGDIVVLPHTQFKIYKVDVRAKNRTYYKVRYDSGQTVITDNRPHAAYRHTVLARFVAQTIKMKTVPTTFKGHATASSCTYHGLALFVRGDRQVYQDWLAQNRPSKWSGGTHEASDVTIAFDPDKTKAPAVIKRYKKIELMCAVIAAHGPSTKDDILRRVATLQGEPWVKGSNGDYFSNPRQMEGCLEKFGKDGLKDTWYLTQAGVVRGSQILAVVGMDHVLSIV